MTTPNDWTPEDEAMAKEVHRLNCRCAGTMDDDRAIVRWHKEKTAKMRAELVLLKPLVQRVRNQRLTLESFNEKVKIAEKNCADEIILKLASTIRAENAERENAALRAELDVRSENYDYQRQRAEKAEAELARINSKGGKASGLWKPRAFEAERENAELRKEVEVWKGKAEHQAKTAGEQCGVLRAKVEGYEVEVAGFKELTRQAFDLMAEWRPVYWRDHACRDCSESPINKTGFTCAYHRAKAISKHLDDKAAQSQPAEGEKS